MARCIRCSRFMLRRTGKGFNGGFCRKCRRELRIDEREKAQEKKREK